LCAKKIDKNEKRRNIALSCFDLIYEVGMKNITVAQVAKTAGIGKGTVYEYFEKKEDIIFEIVNIHIEKYHKEFLEEVKKVTKTKDKIKLFFKNVLDDSEETLKHLNGYKEFLSIVLSENNFVMKEFNCSKNEFFRNELEKIFLDAIKNNELKKESLDLIDGIITYNKGLALRKMSQNSFNAKEDFKKFIDAIFKLIEVKK
jgi:AcrR family transcriptional regulator